MEAVPRAAAGMILTEEAEEGVVVVGQSYIVDEELVAACRNGLNSSCCGC